MEIRFDGKTALITGAGKGIGRILTLKLAEAGANVIAVSRTQSDLDSLKKENPAKIQTICLDIGNWDSTQQALKDIGPVDLLVNNAAILEPKELGELSEEDVDRTLNVNLKAAINISQMIANGMKSRGEGGAIVNVSSIAAEFGIPRYATYCASKGALQQLTMVMATEFGPYKIRVNAVNPTAVRTRMAEQSGFFEENNENAKSVYSRTPLRRMAEPEDIVGPVLFLLSDYAAMITGVSLPIDGGLGVCFF